MNYRERAEQLACCRKEKCRAAIERALREAAAEALMEFADSLGTTQVDPVHVYRNIAAEAQRIREGRDGE
jgi:hypothetical protein